MSVVSMLIAGCSGADIADSDSDTVDPVMELTAVVVDNPDSPLAAFVDVQSSEFAKVTLEFEADGVAPLRLAWTEAGTEWRLSWVGMRANTTYTARVVGETEAGQRFMSSELEFSTGALPANLPEFRVSSTDAAGPGITVVSPAAREDALQDGPWAFGLDSDGEVVWLYDPSDVPEGVGPNRNAELTPDGDLLMLFGDGVRAVRSDGSVSADVAFNTHHDTRELPDGSYVGLVAVRERRAVPGVEGDQVVIGDDIVVVDASGAETFRWSSFENLDTDRYPGDLSQNPTRNGQYDWTHANGLAFDGASNNYVMSLRHQNQVVAVSADTGEIDWILGAGGDFTLSSGSWFKSQHAASVSGDTVLLYDNGNEKGNTESRAVRYRLAGNTAEQIWEWKVGFHTSNLGDADLLDSGNVLVCAGGQRGAQDSRIAEVTPSADVVWELNISRSYWIYRAERVPWVQPSDL